jgi:hypothetical protein
MKNQLLFSLTIVLLLFVSCKKKSAGEVNPSDGDLYFTFTINGKNFSIANEEITTSYNDALKKPVFKILAGEYQKLSVVLTTTADMTKPSSRKKLCIKQFRQNSGSGHSHCA